MWAADWREGNWRGEKDRGDDEPPCAQQNAVAQRDWLGAIPEADNNLRTPGDYC